LGGLSTKTKGVDLSPIKSNPGFLGFTLAFFGIFALFLNFISSVFNFIFIDALVKKKYSIRTSWEELKFLGFSFFLFRIIFGLIIMVSVSLPFLFFYFFISNVENTFSIIGPFLFLLTLPLFLTLIFLSLIFLIFVNSFSLVDMYRNKNNITLAIKNTFRKISFQKMESLIYIVALMVLSIAIGIISLIVLFLILLVLMPLGILLYSLILSNIILGIMVSIPILICLIYLINVVLLPISSFMRYFSILSYEKLYDQKVLR
jgi:hypothetical protein